MRIGVEAATENDLPGGIRLNDPVMNRHFGIAPAEIDSNLPARVGNLGEARDMSESHGYEVSSVVLQSRLMSDLTKDDSC